MKRNFNSWTRRFFACVVCGVFAVSVVWAERVSQEDAALVANNFMNVTSSSAHGQKAPAKRMVMKAAAAAEENQFYIYENADGEGWVMVAANDVVRPILAYSETGHFRTDNMPANVKGWLTSYNKQIKHVAETSSEVPEEVKSEWRKLRSGARRAKASVVVSPLVKTGWSQSAPYYNMCPMDGSNRSVTGCVATAMAQVMNYHQWPKQGTGSHTITVNKTKYTVNFSETTYDWDNMLDNYTALNSKGNEYVISGLTTDQKNAVATLMYHCGVAVDMDYSADVSGAYTIDYNGYFSSRGTMCAETALKQFFGYNSETVKGYYRDGDSQTGMKSWTKSAWKAMLKEELDAARPIMYAGADSEGGHSFICDGYDSDDYFHFNWGWTNWCDGYYEVDALNTNDPGTGGGNGSYNLQQDVIVGIEPPVTGHSVVKNGTGCTITCANSANNNEEFTATITPTDATYDFTSITIKLGSTTLSKTTHYTLSNDNKTLTIKASAITGDNSNDLTITAVWTKNRYNYALLGEYCTPEEADGMLEKNAALNLTIQPTSGYTLAYPACWDVEMGGNKLTYGTGFTYNASNGAFAISKVTGDVNILVYGGKQVTWMANGSSFATTLTSSDKYVLPTETPDNDCDGREFYGWCAEEYSHETTAPSIVKDGDAATQGNIFYAVFATKGEGGGSSWALVTDASSLQAGDKLVIANKVKNATAGALSSQILGSVESTFDNDNISSLGAGTLEFTLGGTSNAWTLSTSDGLLGATDAKKLAWGNGTTTWSISISSGDATIQNGTSSYGKILYNVNNPRFTTYTSSPSASMLLPQIYRKSGGSSYSDFTTTCSAPCEGELTGITLNTENVKKVFTEGEAFNYDGLVVTALYDGCDNKTVKPTSVSTPNMNQVGEQTITVTYESKSAEYTINVTALPTYAIRFYNNGVQVGETQNVKQGQAAVRPSTDPEACEGYTFVGWATSEVTTETEVKPTIVEDFKATKNQDYYAVFSKTEEGESGGSETKEDELTRATTGVTKGSTTYSNWSGKTVTSDAVYAGNSAGGNDAIQLRSSNSNSGIITTISGGKLKKVIVTWNSNTSGRTLDIYGKTSAYSAATDLYGTNAGTKLGSIASDSQTELTISGNYTFVGVRSNSGAMYIDAITFVWEAAGSGPSSTTYYTTAPSCTTPTEVTVTFNANGGTGEMSAQVLPYNEETALNACTFTREGHSFAGWASSEMGDVVYADKAKVTLTKNTTLYAKWNVNNYTISLATVTNGTISTDPAGNADFGATVTVTATPAENYTLGSISVVDAEEKAVEMSDNTFTMPASNVTVSATFNEKDKYTIRFFNNGKQVGENQTVYVGDTPEMPANPAKPCEDYTFVGWATSEVTTETEVKPTIVEDFKATKNQDYYAVFSKTEEGESGGSETKEDELTRATTGVTKGSTSYSDWSGKTVTSDAVYAGNSAGGNDAIQLRSSNSNSGIITTASGGKIKKVVVTWNSNTTSGRKIDIYGKNAAYSDATDLYNNSAQGTKLGSIADTQTELTISGDYTYVGVRSNSGALYLDAITFVWEAAGSGPSSTTYYTTAPSCEACTAAVTITKGTAKHGSFSIDKVGEQSTCGEALVVTISNIEPASGYRLKEITQEGIEDAIIDQDAKTVTYAKKANGASTINVVFDEIPSYTVLFLDNGSVISQQDVLEGESANKPSDPTPDCNEYTFVGWWTSELAATNTEAKEWVSDFTITGEQKYYAIYSKTEEGESGSGAVEDKLTNSTTGVGTSNTYSAWSGKTVNSDAVYAGQSAGENTTIQLRTKNSNSGIITTASGGKVTKVTVEWHSSTTAGRILDIYGKNSAYSAATDLYGTNAGTKLGSITYGTSTELAITGDYTYIGVRSNDGALYLTSITFTWGSGSSSTTYYSSAVSCSETPTELVNMGDNNSAVQKILRNGQLLIIRDGKTYNIMGNSIQ